jgi:hypothetical protein
MMDNGQTIKTRLTMPAFISWSAAQITEAVFPVPCSLKQKAL